jgi:hypothetical protein
MSVTYGFYNSLNGDRRYDANQMSAIFDGLIIDGVFPSIGTAFVVQANEGLSVNVGIGKAWFNHTWTVNDSIMPMTAPESEVLLDRIDAIVLDIDGTENVRANSIMFIQGTASSNPIRPTMISQQTHHQYPLCYIYRAAGSNEIVQADITNAIGTNETPFVTGILQTISIEQLLGRWQDELDRFMAQEEQDVDDFITEQTAEFAELFAQAQEDLEAEQALLNQWIGNEEDSFLAWFETMRGQLNTDAAGHLQLEIDKEEINRILLAGFVDGSKVFSEDGTSVVSTASDGRVLTKTFTNGFLTMTNVLESALGAEIARMVKTFDSTGLLINTVVTYYS